MHQGYLRHYVQFPYVTFIPMHQGYLRHYVQFPLFQKPDTGNRGISFPCQDLDLNQDLAFS